jgi:hypothetical protein
MILGLVVDGDGRPIGAEMWPENAADLTTLSPGVDRLRAVRDRPGVRGRRPRHDFGADGLAGADASPAAARLFEAARAAPPRPARQAKPPPASPKRAAKRRGRSRRSATPA